MNLDQQENSNLIEFKKREGFSFVVKQQGSYCHCTHFEIDEKTRSANCRACQKVFEPFKVLMIITKRYTEFEMQERRLIKEIEQKLAALESIKKAIVSEKAKLNRILMKGDK